MLSLNVHVELSSSIRLEAETESFIIQQYTSPVNNLFNLVVFFVCYTVVFNYIYENGYKCLIG